MFGDPIVWYLFLGGSGAGAVTVLAALDLMRGHALRVPGAATPKWALALDRVFLARTLAASTVALTLGALCLLVDLGHPERFYYVLVHPTLSVLTFGSYVLAATVLCAAILCAVALFNVTCIPVRIVRGIEAAAVVLGTCTMAYTGAFLMSINFVPLWSNPVLPVLFVLSSLSAGIACALGCAAYEGSAEKASLMHALTRADAYLVALEAVCLTAYLVWVAFAMGGGAAAQLMLGDESWLFWIGFVGVGLVLPLVFDTACSKMNNAALSAIAAACVLIGGFSLRYCIVNVSLV